MSVSWLCHWSVVMQKSTTEVNWVKGVWDGSVLFLRTACDSTVISLQKSYKQKCIFIFMAFVIGPFQRFLFGPPLPLAECKYQFQAWGECDLNTALKTRTGSLKRALHNADCQKTVTISKPCGKLTKPKPQGGFLPSHHKGNMNGLVDSGRSIRCGNSNFPEGNLR